MHVQVGVIKLSGFNARAQQDVAQAVKALTKQGASEFTLDVRDNRGGLYQEGAEVAKLFLEGEATPRTGLSFCLWKLLEKNRKGKTTPFGVN